MKGLIIFVVMLFVICILLAAGVPEPNSTLLEVCYSNVQKELYRQLNKITGDPYEWCRQRYPLY